MSLTVNLKVKIDPATAKRLRNHAKREASSDSRIIRLAIRDYLERHK